MKKNMMMVMMFGLMGAFVMLTGCEDNPDTDNVDQYFDDRGSVNSTEQFPSTAAARMQITPASEAPLTVDGEKLRLMVQGAHSVQWSVQDSTKGVIVSAGSTSAVYMRKAAGDNAVIATDHRGNSAFAVITQP